VERGGGGSERLAKSAVASDLKIDLDSVIEPSIVLFIPMTSPLSIRKQERAHP
jgi:hypothetical protein